MAKAAFCVAVYLLLVLFVHKGQSRYLRDSSSGLVSDGIDADAFDQSSLLLLKGIDSSETCEHMYGFLPCADNLAGYLFQIVVYEYLLLLGERYVTAGSELLFKILGPGVFGACVFHILGALPESIIVLVSGLSNSKETAQERVMTGVGLLAGSTVLLLTVVWGTCVIVGKRDFSERSISKDSESSTSNNSLYKKYRSGLTGSGITTDVETSYTARIMVLSVFPFIIVQLPEMLNLSSGEDVVILISLTVSVALLLSYFLYQVFQPWIQNRRLEYVKHEHLIIGFLRRVQRHAKGKLLTDEGAPNLPVIRRLFQKIDLDEDDFISTSELKDLIMEIKAERIHSDTNEAVTEVLKEFDLDNDHKVSKEEFVNAFVKWLVKRKHAIDSRGSFSIRSRDNLHQERMLEYEKKKQLIIGILKYVQKDALESLLNDDDTPDVASIRRLFERFDLDRDNCISHSELKELIEGITFGKMNLNTDDAVELLMKELDTNGDQKINEEEFVDGIAKWLDSNRSLDEFYLETWKETDKLMDEQESSGGSVDSPWTCIKAVLLLLLGTVILSFLAEPLIETVQDFSVAASIPSFYVSFILVPLATKSREALAAIMSASRKKTRTTSLTFSEIYGGVFMNNMLGLAVLLFLVYARGMTWDFSAEALVVFIICGVMGLIASFRSTFPLWTSLFAYLLYPFSLVLVYVFINVYGWS